MNRWSMTNTTGVSMDEDLVGEIDDNKMLAGCTNRSEFIRQACKEKLARLSERQ